MMNHIRKIPKKIELLNHKNQEVVTELAGYGTSQLENLQWNLQTSKDLETLVKLTFRSRYYYLVLVMTKVF
jgi:hypothetical protein